MVVIFSFLIDKPVNQVNTLYALWTFPDPAYKYTLDIVS